MVVYANKDWSVIRTMSYGFRCNAESASWHIEFQGKFYMSVLRKKDGVKFIESQINAI